MLAESVQAAQRVAEKFETFETIANRLLSVFGFATKQRRTIRILLSHFEREWLLKQNNDYWKEALSLSYFHQQLVHDCKTFANAEKI